MQLIASLRNDVQNSWLAERKNFNTARLSNSKANENWEEKIEKNVSLDGKGREFSRKNTRKKLRSRVNLLTFLIVFDENDSLEIELMKVAVVALVDLISSSSIERKNSLNKSFHGGWQFNVVIIKLEFMTNSTNGKIKVKKVNAIFL